MWRRLLVLTGLAALAAWFLRRRTPARESIEADPADELRRKLDETRAQSDETKEPATDLDERRREVHERGRAATEEMQRPTPD